MMLNSRNQRSAMCANQRANLNLHCLFMIRTLYHQVDNVRLRLCSLTIGEKYVSYRTRAYKYVLGEHEIFVLARFLF